MSYVPRILYTVPDVTLCSEAIRARQHVLLLGPRGCGKTSLAQAIADDLGRKLVHVPCHTGASAEMLIGQWVPERKGRGFRWLDGRITTAVRHGHIVLLDEVNALKPDVAFCLHGLLDHRRELILADRPGDDGGAEVLPAHPDFGLIAAGNPNYDGTRPLNAAFRDRFAVQIAVTPNPDIDIEVLRASDAGQLLEAEQLGVVETFIRKIRDVERTGQPLELSTRAILDFAWNLAAHGYPIARALLLTRFDDEGDRSAIRTVLRDLWANDGALRSPAGRPA